MRILASRVALGACVLLFTIGLLAVLGLLSGPGEWGAWGLLGLGLFGLLALSSRGLTVSVSRKGVQLDVRTVRDLPGYDDVEEDGGGASVRSRSASSSISRSGGATKKRPMR